MTSDNSQQMSEQAIREIAMEDYRANLSETSDRLKYQVEFAQSALKNLHLVNGGAIIALLTFIGNVNVEFDYRSLWWGFAWFCIGLTSSLMAYLGAYFSQAYFMNHTQKEAWSAQARARGMPDTSGGHREFKIGNIHLVMAIVFTFLSVVCFVIGSLVSLSGFK